MAGIVLVSGTLVTGSGPHGGDEAADRLPFAVTSVARVQTLAVWAFLALVLVVLHQATRGDAAPDALTEPIPASDRAVVHATRAPAAPAVP